jgi:saccharopine dehydrogenase-like NADP-dependent oxidoreductase
MKPLRQRIVILGAGSVGRTIARDLHPRYAVTVVDRDDQPLALLRDRDGIEVQCRDLSNPAELARVVEPVDLVVGSLPGKLGYSVLQRVIDLGKNIVDVSFFPEDPFPLDGPAKQQAVTAIIDCGLAPGMNNIILGYHTRQMTVTRFTCLVGGLPVEHEWPLYYKAVFSPTDVIEEYIRPARYMENGTIVTRPALSEPEIVDIPPVGPLEAVLTDGLRTLLRTMKVPNMVEKTLRYPGSVDILRALRELGFFSDEPLPIHGHSIAPLDMTTRLLLPHWKLQPGEEDFTVMRIVISGDENGKTVEYAYNLYHRYDTITGTLSMAQTTGFTASAVANLVLSGKFNRVGLSPPEYIGFDAENYSFILDYLKQRGVIYRVEVKQLSTE